MAWNQCGAFDKAKTEKIYIRKEKRKLAKARRSGRGF